MIVDWTETPPGSGLYTATSYGTTTPGRRLTQGWLDATQPRRTVIWTYRDGAVQDGYIVYRRQRPFDSRHLSLRGRSLLSYFDRRTLTVTKTYTAVDQHDIARDLVSFAQAQPAGGINVAADPVDSGVLRDRQPIAFYYERKNIGELIAQLAAVEGGFEYAVDVAAVADVPVATFRPSYPKRGRRLAQSGLVMFRTSDQSGNLLDYSLDEDGTAAVTTVHGIGAGEGTDMLLATASDTSLLDQGYPLEEGTISHKDVSIAATLASHAAAAVRRRSAGEARWELRVDPDDVSVPFGSWIVGDEVRVIIEDDERFPAGPNGENGLDATLRIVGQSITVPDDGGPDQVVLTVRVPVDV